jgi:hypothetical protein
MHSAHVVIISGGRDGDPPNTHLRDAIDSQQMYVFFSSNPNGPNDFCIVLTCFCPERFEVVELYLAAMESKVHLLHLFLSQVTSDNSTQLLFTHFYRARTLV